MKHLLEAICKSGTYVGTECEWCGREHFCNFYEDGNWDDENEDGIDQYLDELREKHKQNPDKYIAHDEAISSGYFEGKRIVWGCPCNEKSLSRYVEHYWGHSEIIAEFLKNKAQEEATVSKVRTTLLESIENKSKQALKDMTGY